MPAEVTASLRQRAQRLLPFTEGNFTASGPPSLLDALTDASLVVASGIVSEEAPQLSGKAQLRLLAWLLADARGATTPIDKKLAETVGKRLDAQVKRVRSAIEQARSLAEQQRAEARAAAALIAQQVKPERLAAIDAAEQKALNAPNKEIYVGFWELGAGAGEALPPAAALPSHAAVLAVAPEEPEPEPVPSDVLDRWEEEDRPRLCRWRREGGPVPAHVAQCLGEEGCRMLARDLVGHTEVTGYEILEIFIPRLVNNLVARCARVEMEHAEDLQCVREECDAEVARAQASEAEWHEDWQLMRTSELEANARVGVLREIIERNLLA